MTTRDVTFHPRALEKNALGFGHRARPPIGDCSKLSRAQNDLQLRPVWLDVLSERLILVQDNEDDRLLINLLDLVRIIVLNRRKRLGDGIGSSPSLEINGARFVVK